MSRFHMHVVVENLDISTRFYTALFGAEPTTVKEDYVKWVMDDPSINFVITSRGHIPGLDHVGIQTDTDEQLQALQARLEAAGITGQTQTDAACCYERSNKHWTLDPQGIAWESFTHCIRYRLSTTRPLNRRCMAAAHRIWGRQAASDEHPVTWHLQFLPLPDGWGRTQATGLTGNRHRC